jgi:uncharacterized protein (TIGR00255 family)
MKSMTGYGQANWQRGGTAITVEVRAVNQRFLEVKLNMPREYLPWEAELRALVQERVARGKVDVAIFRGGTRASAITVEPNVALAKAYVTAWRQLQRVLGVAGEIDLALLQGRNELLRVREVQANARGEITHVRATVRRAISAFNREREREGRALGRDMAARVRRLQQLEQQLMHRVGTLAPQLTARLRERVAGLLEGIAADNSRLLQEVAFLVERSDVTEELVRLESHLSTLAGLFRSRDPIGKKLDFLLQEVHREFTTIASKSIDLEVTDATLEARSEIEKLREQAQNVE